MKRRTANDDWFDSEPHMRDGMLDELRRLTRRATVRPWRVIAIAVIVTAAITTWLGLRPQPFEAEVVLAWTESEFSPRDRSTPVDLRDYVGNVLLSNERLTALIEQRNLYPARKLRGPQYAIDALRGQLEIEIWKNMFGFDDPEPGLERSARIGLTVTDSDPERAYTLAHDLAATVIAASRERRQTATKLLVDQAARTRARIETRLEQLTHQRLEHDVAADRARAVHDIAVAEQHELAVAELRAEQRSLERSISELAQSSDEVADQITRAGLDFSLGVVEERHPERPTHRVFELAVIAFIVLLGSLATGTLVLGAFDPRVHDGDDVARLGLPMLGQLPAFRGDDVGALRARAARPVYPKR